MSFETKGRQASVNFRGENQYTLEGSQLAGLYP